MSLRVLLRDHGQRSIALLTSTHALTFRHAPSVSSNSSASKPTLPRCVVEFVAVDHIDLTEYRSIPRLGVHGTLGLINVNTDIFLCVITAASPVAELRPREHVQRIVSVEFYCLNKSDYDRELLEDINQYDANDASADSYENLQGPEHHDGTLEHPYLALRKMLSSGTFYYSADFDLTNRLQNRSAEETAFDIDSLDDGYLWNSYMINPLIQFRSRLAMNDRETLDRSHIITSAIRGYVETMVIPASASPLKNTGTNYPSHLTLISRLSCRRAGTRFNSRGVDDDGNVANFVETETVYWFPSGLCFSYAQIRGSVPIFWEQATGLLPHQQKIQITRSPEATQPAFDKHFESLELKYGTIHVLNLLSETKQGEVDLTDRYNYHMGISPLNHVFPNGETSDHCMLQGTQFDFHAETKGPGGYEAASSVRRLIRGHAEGFVYYLSDNVQETDPRSKALVKRAIVMLQQEGVFRTNCVDCLDRTNLIQTIISQMALEEFLRHRGEYALADFWMRHSTLWADNGDALSKIYAGTGALKSSFTRSGKMSFAGALADARKSATRMYINNFVDKGRQNTIDMLLGRLVDQSPVLLYDPINDYVTAELKRRFNEYSTSETINIWVGTFNLNGKGRGIKEDLSEWLCPKMNRSQHSAEIVAVGFQEIVELSPQQIMSTDPARRQEWESAVARTLNEDARKRGEDEYILLRSGQLVGAALMVFVKSTVLKSIKNVEGSLKKTGLSGMAGNKGAVAIRMDFANTGICFITAHLAAGFANYDERNRDYRTISHGLRFQRNRSIEDHDTILWLGDFNYRIGLTDDKVRRLINAGDLGTLYQNDQLHLQMVAGNTFPYYSEARITFLPTYKYNNGTDEYDTSEKARIPAWCDRILHKGENLRQIHYNTAPLRFSDHRPIFATFECTISVVDETIKERLARDIYNKRCQQVGNASAITRTSDVEDEDLLGYESIAPGLPAASSDRRKWWLNNGLPARSTIADSKAGYVPNPRRPSNPFIPSDEPDWVAVQKSQSADIDRRNRAHSIRSLPTSVEMAMPHSSGTISPIQFHSITGTESAINGASLGRTASSASSASSSPRVVRKPAPPVPKKPAVLTQQPPSERERPPETVSMRLQGAPPNRLTKLKPVETGFPPPPHRFAQTDQGIPSPRASSSVLPPRPSSNALAATGLMDEDDDHAASIPSLLPSLRR